MSQIEGLLFIRGGLPGSIRWRMSGREPERRKGVSTTNPVNSADEAILRRENQAEEREGRR